MSSRPSEPPLAPKLTTVSPKKKNEPPKYERPEMGPGSESAQSSLRQIMAQGVAAWESDDFQSAYEHFSGIIEKQPGFADVRNKAGLCLAMMGDTENALDEFDEALKLNDRYAEAHLNRAIVLNDLGRFEEGVGGLPARQHPGRTGLEGFPVGPGQSARRLPCPERGPLPGGQPSGRGCSAVRGGGVGPPPL